MKSSVRTEHLIGVLIFWICIMLVSFGFLLESYWSCLLFLFILPIMFGTHEAIHENIIPHNGGDKIKRINNDLTLLIGCSFQIMNFKLLRQAHLKHHALGRYGEGYSPDIVTGNPKMIHYVVYYSYLTFIPAILYQLVGFILVFLPAMYLPFDYKLDLSKDKSSIPYSIIQISCLLCLIAFIYFGGIYKFLIYESFFVFMWCILQNSAHYGLKGINSRTDRVCAHTYILEKPFKLLTFGSTSHLAHHVDMDIPCLDLYNINIFKEIEKKIGVEIIIKHGIKSFVKDVFAQFRGPLTVEQLHTSWIKSINPNSQIISDDDAEFVYRKGIKRKNKLN